MVINTLLRTFVHFKQYEDLVFSYFEIFLFCKLWVYLFIYLWLCWVFVSVRGLSLVAASGATLHRGARTSHHHGLSCCGAQAPDVQAQ